MSKHVSPLELDVVRTITPQTQQVLQDMGLWENGDVWTPSIMWELARGEDSDGVKMYEKICFEQVILSVRKMAKGRIVPLMNEYVLALEGEGESREYVKDAFEYAMLFEQKTVLKKLVERFRKSMDLEEWGTVYDLMLEVLEGSLSEKGIIRKSRDAVGHVYETVLKTRLELLEMFAYERLGYPEKSVSLIDHLPEQFLRIKPGFTKSVLASRAMLCIANSLLYVKGNIGQAEKYYSNVLDNSMTPEAVRAYAHHGLALATLYKEGGGLPHLEKAIDYAERLGLNDYRDRLKKNDYPFLRNVSGEQFDVEGVDVEEQIHQYVVRGECERALVMIKELESQGRDTALLEYYKGKATKDKNVLAYALKRLEVENQAFLLPLIKEEMGIPV
ncbi:AimR family lysis-lysogeny pheromone receptor [Bacillus sp. FSL W7-1360]